MEAEDFAARAETADKRIAALTKRCEAIETNVLRHSSTPVVPLKVSNSTSSKVDKNTIDLVQQLQQIRQAVLSEFSEVSSLQLENTKLTETNQRLDYRIRHLQRSAEQVKGKAQAV